MDPLGAAAQGQEQEETKPDVASETQSEVSPGLSKRSSSADDWVKDDVEEELRPEMRSLQSQVLDEAENVVSPKSASGRANSPMETGSTPSASENSKGPAAILREKLDQAIGANNVSNVEESVAWLQRGISEIVGGEKPKELPTRDLVLRVPPNEPNHILLDAAEQALAAQFGARHVHKERFRTVLELGEQPITIDIGLSRDLDRCVLIRATEPVPDNLFSALRDCYGHLNQSASRSASAAAQNELHEEPIDGFSVTTLLDSDYVAMLMTEMKARSEKDLTAFATPLERRAKDDERRVKRLEKLLESKYAASGLPVPVGEKAPPLSSFALDIPGPPAMLTLSGNPTPNEIDIQLKLAVRKNLDNESLARQERKKKECLVRAEICERNRFQLVSVLANSQAALRSDMELMQGLEVNPPQVALCRAGCVFTKKPGFLVITSQLIIFEPVGMFGFRLGNILKLEAKSCRSVMKGQGNIGIADSLCIRTDTHDEYTFYFPTIEEVNEQMDMVFELIWQVLRMNRWTPGANSAAASAGTIPPDGIVTV